MFFKKTRPIPPLFRYLDEIVKSINYGGSVIHTINPGRPNDTNDAGISGEMSLRYLAGESGGSYFIGSDTQDIVKRIEKSTSAYYEMVFYIDPGVSDKLEVELKCKREGVRYIPPAMRKEAKFTVIWTRCKKECLPLMWSAVVPGAAIRGR